MKFVMGHIAGEHFPVLNWFGSAVGNAVALLGNIVYQTARVARLWLRGSPGSGRCGVSSQLAYFSLFF